ncbi:MAG: PAS domain S-box protein, partial [Methylococcales bacterium]|nr:PAS domain S-box protein [Methylococcales bacterium]
MKDQHPTHILNNAEHTNNKLLLMQTAVEQSASAVVITNAKGAIEYVNPKFIELTGFSAKELLGHNPKILQAGNTTEEQYKDMWQSLLENDEWQGELKNKKKNGDIYWAHESISVIKNEAGEITNFLAVEEDITQRKQVENALIESEQRFRQMAEMTGEWLWEQDPEGYYIYSSTAVKTILGINPEDIIGRHYTELLTAEDKSDLQKNSTIHKPFYALSNHYRHKNGQRVITESTGLPITDNEG